MTISREEYEKLIERIEDVEFKQQLLFNGDTISRILFEYNITRHQYTQIMDLMDSYRTKIGSNKHVNHGAFEQEIYGIVPDRNMDYHFCEDIALAFKECNRWEEVFDALYGDMPKFK